jgi:hypothetical protein
MRNLAVSMVLAALVCVQVPSQAQVGFQRGYAPTQQTNPYGNPYASPYGVTPYNPYNPYGNPYGYNPYRGAGLVPNTGFGVVNPYAGLPAMGMPVPINGGYFGINIGNARLNVWKAPSGYYYPWLPRPVGFGYQAPIVIVNQGSTTPAAPALTTIFGDMNKFLDEAKTKGKVSEADYNHLKLRASDLQKKERSLATANGGSLQKDDEEQLRKDVDKLGEEVAYRVKS